MLEVLVPETGDIIMRSIILAVGALAVVGVAAVLLFGGSKDKKDKKSKTKENSNQTKAKK